MENQHWDKMFESCPFCGNKGFLAGPRGGRAQNFKCSDCGAAFNNMGPFGVDLLSEPGINILVGE